VVESSAERSSVHPLYPQGGILPEDPFSFSARYEPSPPAILMCAVLENPHMWEILELLYQHPHLTRHQIAQHLGKSPDTIYWHLINLDSSLLTVQKKRGGHLYSLSPEAGRIYTELTHHRIS